MRKRAKSRRNIQTEPERHKRLGAHANQRRSLGQTGIRGSLGPGTRSANKRGHGLAYLQPLRLAALDMPAMIARLCSAAGCPHLVEKGRGECPKHATPSKPAHVRYADPAWRRLSKAARQAQPYCSFCGSHFDLTLDHVMPGKGAGGYLVLCRSCNSSKGTKDIQEALDKHRHPSSQRRNRSDDR